MNKLGLYIHIPFCRVICPYCDFYKMIAKDKIKSQYIDYLLKEIAIHKQNIDLQTTKFRTLYLGGGTPSSLALSDLERLLRNLDEWLDLKQLEEVTIEVNPEDINVDLIDLLVKYHITRISLGLQSFNKKAQMIILRHHDYDDIAKKIELIKQKGIIDISLDLMFGIPGIGLADVLSDLDLFLALEPTHLSCYSLILEEKTLFYHQYLQGDFCPMDADEEAIIYYQLRDKLIQAGFTHYETSNFARWGYESKHNLIYWNNEKYLGMGAGSSSYLKNQRLKTINHLDSYFNRLQVGLIERSEVISLSPLEQMNEEIILGLRKIKGIDIEHFQAKFNQDLFIVFPKINELIKDGILIKHHNHLAIKSDKQYIANYILGKII